MDVNTNETSPDQGSTIHSADENLDDGIPISERPLNEFNLQVILEKTESGSPMTLETIT